MSETKKCRKCGETKPLEAFHSGLVCRACRNEQQRIYRAEHSIKPRRFVFDDLLARWVLTHAKKPNSGRPRSIVAYSCAGVRTKDGGEFDDGEFLIILGSERERVVSPKFGNPMVVYQHESGELLSNVRAKENTVERSEQEVLELDTEDSGAFDPEWIKLRDRILARIPKSKVPRYAGI